MHIDDIELTPYVSKEAFEYIQRAFDVRELVYSNKVTLDTLRGIQDVLDLIKTLTPKEVQ